MDTALALALYLIPVAGEKWNGTDGDNGNSWGPYQISQAYLDEVNQFSGCNYTKADCYNPVYARRMTEIYLKHWGTHDKLGHQPSTRDLVRIHNGGPDGWHEHCTLHYWNKCKMQMRVAVHCLKLNPVKI